MSNPTPYWTPGSLYRGTQRVAVWTRDHGTWDEVKGKGHTCGNLAVAFSLAAATEGGVKINAYLRADYVTPAEGHGEHHPDADAAYAAGFAYGHIGVTEVLESRPTPTHMPRSRPDPEDAAWERDVDLDPDGVYAEGAAHNMVYGR